MSWRVRDNPAPRARARAQVAAFATRGAVFIGLKKLFRKQSIFFEIFFIDFLVDYPCLLILFINIFHIYFHCLRIRRCYMGGFIISCNSNWRFRVYSCFCINIISVFTPFFGNVSSVNSFLNFIIDLIWLFWNIFNITNFFFVNIIIIFQRLLPLYPIR